MTVFKPGDRVLRTETGEVGTVRLQFMDGYVGLMFDDGHPAELDSASLQRIQESASPAGESSVKTP